MTHALSKMANSMVYRTEILFVGGLDKRNASITQQYRLDLRDRLESRSGSRTSVIKTPRSLPFPNRSCDLHTVYGMNSRTRASDQLKIVTGFLQ